jgi:hypothetical protein
MPIFRSALTPFVLSAAVAVPIFAGVDALQHAVASPPSPPSASQVTFDQVTPIGDGSTAIQVLTTNANAAPVTIHSVILQFGSTTVTEPVNDGPVTIPGGNQEQELFAPAPQSVLNGTAIATVTGWR